MVTRRAKQLVLFATLLTLTMGCFVMTVLAERALLKNSHDMTAWYMLMGGGLTAYILTFMLYLVSRNDDDTRYVDWDDGGTGYPYGRIM